MIIIFFAILTLLVLIVGIFFMAKGGESNKKYSNKLMTLRVILQALTIVLLGVAYFLYS